MLRILINDTERIFMMLFCLLAAFIVNLLLQKILFKNIIKNLSEKADITRIKFFQHLTTTAIWLIGIGLAFSFIPAFYTLSHTILAGAGLISIVVSLSSQQALSNIISGVLLIVYKPFKIGEKIKVGDIMGRVNDIDLRQTTLIDEVGNIIIMPNSNIGSQTIIKLIEKGND
ncbi:MscS Mechanosensitive ion channel [Emticicia oligotrophica DSM 17448]|uniref:MscS Mechanosensitive ion channel n=1 Tax=Emticicia oligotrophica (strain DSM 17448 / CIP 109782 / MTCC 6937 / GPTSA100-15) TaxID=929562 RepID=A0ABM5N452_EMTOG|nr:mechanosensitive ion channel domain-containing protein [Emticicia oligotrophica]AFK04233.1 MscS Mechanosensitive ion channel [Emticicia oligotrophica DSM 17448]